MGILLKYINWIIIGFALFNLATYYQETEEKLVQLDSQISSETDSTRRLVKTEKEIKNFFVNIDEVKANIEKVAQEIEKNQLLLPSEIYDSENLSLLRKMAEDVNIKELSIAPEKDEDNGFYISRKYKFKAKATYLQFLIMFEKIDQNKRIFNIIELDFNKIIQIQRSKFQLISGEFTMEAYKFNANFKEDRGIEAIEKSFLEGGVKPVSVNTQAKQKQ